MRLPAQQVWPWFQLNNGPINPGGHCTTRDSQDTVGRPVNGLVEICIVKDDVRALPAEFEGDILEVGPGSGLHDLPAYEGRTSKCNLLNAVVLADGLSDGRPVSDNEVEDTRRDAGFAEHVGRHESGQGSQLGGLHDNGVSGSESGANLPGPHQDCEGKYIR